MHKKLSQSGFGHVLVFIFVILVVGVVGFTAYTVLGKSRQKSKSNEVTWAFDEQKLTWYTKSGKAPACPKPFIFDQTPMDVTQATAILMPGTYRGFNYKPHGAFGTPESLQGKIDVRMPMDATLVGLKRYYDGNPADLQYLLTFESDCGIAFRFDHIYTLTPELQALAEKTPEAKSNDTRSSPDEAPPRTKFKSGQIIATHIGMPSMKIYGFDFGVYDYRKPNEISKNTKWAAIHNQYQAQEWFGVCWFDMLPGKDPDVVKILSLKQGNTQKTVNITSDYCSNAPHKTLEFNDGKPTDG